MKRLLIVVMLLTVVLVACTITTDKNLAQSDHVQAQDEVAGSENSNSQGVDEEIEGNIEWVEEEPIDLGEMI